MIELWDGGVTDRSTGTDVLQPCRNDWHNRGRGCQKCRYCGGCIFGRPPRRAGFTRRDTKYCSGKCRTAACRKREKAGIKEETDGKLQQQR